jgi:tripartite-type tricarboxylate transporter receptor subunit TctC
MNRRIFLALLAALAAGPAIAAADWPAKPVRILVPFPPGGSTDVLARLIGQRLSDKLGRPFVVENRPGAGGNIGTDAIAKAAPDGYTIGLSTSGPLANNKFLYKSMPYDAEKDLTPIILVGEIPLVLVANTTVKASDLRSFLGEARASASKYAVGNPGNGTIGHLAFELLKMTSGVDIVGVPYKGDTPALTDLMGGAIQALSAPITAFIPHIKAGKLRGLAVTSKTRFAGLPEVPTAKEQGIDLEATVWFAFVGPAGMPREVVTRLNQGIALVLGSEEGRAKLAQYALALGGGSSAHLGSLMTSEAAKWKRVIETAKVTMQ